MKRLSNCKWAIAGAWLGVLQPLQADQVIARYDAGLAGGPAPISPTNYTHNGQNWLGAAPLITGVTNGPVMGDGTFNAWNTSDNSIAAGSVVNFTYPLSANVHDLATNSGWILRARTRIVTSFGGPDACFIEYGKGTSEPRFLLFLGLNSANNLTVQVQGLGTLILTTNGQGNAAYHLHEILGEPSGKASYYFDGQLITNNWDGFTTVSAVDGVRFGTGSSAGQGSMNFNLVEFVVLGTAPAVTTLPAINLEPYQASLAGNVIPGGLPTTTWFQRGTTTNYGSTTTPVSAGNGTNSVNFIEDITGLTKGGTYHFRCVAANAFGSAFGADETFTTPTQFTVTTRANSGDGSLRQSIVNAKAGDTILFATNGAIALTTSELVIAKSLTIAGPGPTTLAVSGGNSNRVFRITSGVTVNISGLTLRNGRSLDGADSSSTNDPGAAGQAGGGLHNLGTLTLSNCVITANVAGSGGEGFQSVGTTTTTAGGEGGPGGGIYNGGTLTFKSCTIWGNTAGAGGRGGGGHGAANGAAGGAGSNGGGIYNAGILNVNACTLSGNFAGIGGQGGDGQAGGVGGNGGAGGAIYNAGTLSMTGSTLHGNTAGKGGIGGSETLKNGNGGDGGNGGSSGAIYSSGVFALTACTIAGNTSGAGGNGANGSPEGGGGTGGNSGDAGGAFNDATGAEGTLRNTLIAANANGLVGAGGTPNGISGVTGFAPDVKGTVTSEGHNLIGKNDGNASFLFAPSATGDQIGTLGLPINPLLGSLANYGGPTATRALLAGSPARDTGDNSLAGALGNDQRGYSRLSGVAVDIGAFEVQVVSSPPLLQNPLRLSNGAFGFAFTNIPGASFSALTSTNVALPLSSWVVLGGALEVSPGQYQFIDSTQTNAAARFYVIRWQ